MTVCVIIASRHVVVVSFRFVSFLVVDAAVAYFGNAGTESELESEMSMSMGSDGGEDSETEMKLSKTKSGNVCALSLSSLSRSLNLIFFLLLLPPHSPPSSLQDIVFVDSVKRKSSKKKPATQIKNIYQLYQSLEPRNLIAGSYFHVPNPNRPPPRTPPRYPGTHLSV